MQYETKTHKIHTDKSTHSEMGPMRPNPENCRNYKKAGKGEEGEGRKEEAGTGEREGWKGKG